jgi:predicted RNA-binding protein with RPS1 domain
MSKKLFRRGEIVKALVTYKASYGVLVKLEGNQKGLIHISEIPFEKKGSLKKGDIIQARVLENTVKGYRLTLRAFV